MKIELKSLLLPALAVAAIGLGAWWCCREGRSDDEGPGNGSVSYRSKRAAGKKGKSGRVEHRIGNTANRGNVPAGKSARQLAAIPAEIENLSEEDLKGLCKELMEELKDVTKNDSLRRIRKAIALFNLPESKGGLGGMVPKVLRMQAVEALGSCGAGAIPDLVDFLADANAEVAEQAVDQIKDEISDPELSDQERADLLVTMMKAMVDGDDISMMLLDLNGLPDSIRGDALLRILDSGSSQAQKVVKNELQIYTEIDVKDAESLKEWTDRAKKLEAGQDEVIKADDKGTSEPSKSDVTESAQ